MTNIDPVWKVLITPDFVAVLQPSQHFRQKWCFVTRGPLWLGVTERFRQPSGVFAMTALAFWLFSASTAH